MPAALAAADVVLNRSDWKGVPGNPQQQTWLARFRHRATEASTMAEIQSHATTLAPEHGKWLARQGWEAQITQGQPGDLFLAAVLNIVAKWKEAGKAYEEDGVHRAVVKRGCYLFEGKGPHPMIEVLTRHPSYRFCFQQVKRAPTSLAELAEQSLEMAVHPTWDGGDVHLDFPMVDMLARNEAPYMIGLHAGSNVVVQASEQLRLELNEIGGRASAAAEVAVSRGISLKPRVIKIDGPFLVAVRRANASAGVENIVFAAYCDRDVWGRPAKDRI